MVFRNIIIVFLAFAILTGGFYFPKKAEAYDYPDWLVGILAGIKVVYQNIGNVLKKTKMLQDIARWVKEDMMKSIRDVLAKRIIDYIIDQTVTWVQGGGKPQFVTDWKGFLKSAGDIAFDSVIRDTFAARLCAPFRASLRVSLIPIPRFSQRVECTLDQVVANIQDFYNDFSKGGWLAYAESFYPANNYYGVQLMAMDEIARRTLEEQQAKANEARAGSGFLNVTRCVERDPNALAICDLDEDARDREACIAAAPCIKKETMTPGDAVGKTVASAITSDKDWAANIQSWTAALINAAINRVVKEGITGIKNFMSGSGDGSSRTPDFNPVSGTGYSELMEQELANQKDQMLQEPRIILDNQVYVLGAKQRSSDSVQARATMLNRMKLLSCSEPATDAEVQAARSELAKLDGEIDQLEASISEIRDAIEMVETAPDYNALSLSSSRIARIGDKYRSSDYVDVVTDNPNGGEAAIPTPVRQAADRDVQEKQTALDAVQTRFNACAPLTVAAATCTAPGNHATLSWPRIGTSTQYAVRIDDLANSFAVGGSGCPTIPNAGDFCGDAATTTLEFDTTPSHSYNWWVHGCSEAGCGPASDVRAFTCAAELSSPH